MGLAVLRAQQLETEVEQLGIWDGQATTGEAGFEVETSSSLTSWRNSPSEVNSRRSVTVKLSCFFSAIDSFLELLEYVRKRQARHDRGAPASLHLLARCRNFAADVTQCHPALAA